MSSPPVTARDTTRAPATAFKAQPARLSALTWRIGSFVQKIAFFFHAGLCLARPKFKAHVADIPVNPPALAAIHTQSLVPLIEAIRAERLAALATLPKVQRSEPDLEIQKMQTESLLNQVSKESKFDTEASLKKLRACLNSQNASIKEYATLMELSLTDETWQALSEFDNSYKLLQKDCLSAEKGAQHHAKRCCQALKELPHQLPGTHVRYAGTFGKKHPILLGMLNEVHAHEKSKSLLPAFLIKAMDQGALDTPKDVLAYSIDIVLEHLTGKTTKQTAEDFHAALEFLKPFLPDPKRRSSIWDKIAPSLPAWLAKPGQDVVAQGALSVFLDILPDSTFRDLCVDLVEKCAQGAHSDDQPQVFLEWKEQLLQKALTQLPGESLEQFNEEMEEAVSSLLSGIDPAVEKCVREQLSSFGSYWLEWSYDHDKASYSLAIYASGNALRQASYPLNRADNPIWPLRFDRIVLPECLPELLEKMSETTAVVNGWKRRPPEYTPITASRLLGEEISFISLLKSAHPHMRQSSSSALPGPSVNFTQADMVCHYHDLNANPRALRYGALRKALLEACAPFAAYPPEGGPPSLKLPEGEEGVKVLQLFQHAVKTLKKLSPKDKLVELNAFEKQLNLTQKARLAQAPELKPKPPADKPSEEGLGLILDGCLQALCRADQDMHVIAEYKELLIFILGKKAEWFIERLCKRATELHERAQAEIPAAPVSAPAPTPKAAAAPPASQIKAPPKHREGGPIRKLLFHKAVVLCGNMLWLIRRIERFLENPYLGLTREVLHSKLVEILPQVLPAHLQTTYQHLQKVYRKLYAVCLRQIRELLFALLFPHLKNVGPIAEFHKTLAPYMAVLSGKEVKPSLPIPIPPPARLNLSKNPCTVTSVAMSGREVQEKPIDISTHPWFLLRAKCKPITTFDGLASTLYSWHELGGLHPKLLNTLIHSLPLMRDKDQFQTHFPVKPTTQQIERVMWEAARLGELLQAQFNIGLSWQVNIGLSWQEYQLAQYHLLAFMDSLARQTADHPFEDALLDADGFLEECQSCVKDRRCVPIHPTERAHIEKVLKYFYPHITTLDELVHHPLSEQERRELKQQRWFCNIDEDSAASQYLEPLLQHIHSGSKELYSDARFSPEFQYYVRVSEQMGDTYLKYRSNTLYPIKVPYTKNERAFDLFCVAHDALKFEHPLHFSVPYLRRQMLRCRGRRAVDPRERLEKEKRLVFKELTPPSGMLERLQRYITTIEHSWPTHSDENEGFAPLICYSASTPLYAQENPYLPNFEGPLAPFWKAQKRAIDPKQDSSFAGAALAPSIALSVIAKNSGAASAHIPILKSLMLCLGNLETCLRLQPALIQQYAEGCQTLFLATSNVKHLFEIFELALALKARACQINPDCQDFAFLEEAIERLYEKSSTQPMKWRTQALKTLLYDHPNPKMLKAERQQEALSLLLSTLSEAYIELQHPHLHAALEQMAIHYLPCMKEQKGLIPSIRPAQRLTPQQELRQQWEQFKQYKKNSGLFIDDEAAHIQMQYTPMVTCASPEGKQIYKQSAKITRLAEGLEYTLLLKQEEYKPLLHKLADTFPWILTLKNNNAQCWLHQEGASVVNGSKATLLVTCKDKQLRFALEYRAPSYELLGLIDPQSSQIIYPASQEQAAKWCAGFEHFCPLASMVLLVDRATQHPVRLHMTQYKLEFSFKPLPEQEGTFRLENTKLYPGFWICPKQSVPFGLVLENQQGGKHLLLPSNNLPHQAAFARLNPFFGALGPLVQRHKIFHTKGKLHVYEYRDDQWKSDDPIAMVHLLMLYFASQDANALYHVGSTLLRMSLPDDLEMELLPLNLSQDSGIRLLHAKLLAALETSRLSKDAKTPAAASQKVSFISAYLPKDSRQLFAFIDVYRSLMRENLDPMLRDILFARFNRMLNMNRAHLARLFACETAAGFLRTDCLALRLLPPNIAKEIRGQEALIGNTPSMPDLALCFANAWNASSAQGPNAMLSRVQHCYQEAAQLLSPYNPETLTGTAYQQMPDSARLKQHMIRFWLNFKSRLQEPLTPDACIKITPQIQLEPVDPGALPPLSSQTLIPFFLSYLKIAQGHFGAAFQVRLLQQLHLVLMQPTSKSGIEDRLSRMLLSICMHPKRFMIFHYLHNHGCGLASLLMQQKQQREQEAQIERGFDPALATPADLTALKAQLDKFTSMPKDETDAREIVKLKARIYIAATKATHIQNERDRHEALSSLWESLIYFDTIQPQWKNIEDIAATALCMSSTSQVPSLSEEVLTRISKTIAPHVEHSPALKTLNKVLPQGVGLGLMAYMMHARFKKQQLLGDVQQSSQSLPQTEGLSLLSRPLNALQCKAAAQTLSPLARTAIAMFGTRYVLELFVQHAFAPLQSRVQSYLPKDADVALLKKRVQRSILITSKLYMAYRIYNAYKSVTEEMLCTKKIVQLPKGEQPCILPECQKAMHAENARWNAYLDDLFMRYFDKVQVANKVPSLEGIQSTTIQNSLQHYASQTGQTRTLFTLRSAEELDNLGAEVSSLLSELEAAQRYALQRLFSALGIELGNREEAKAAFSHFFATGQTNLEFFQKQGITEKEQIRHLQRILPFFFLRQTQQQQLRRIIGALKQVKRFDPNKAAQKWETACENLSTQLQARRVYDISALAPQRLAQVLAFESVTSTLLWKAQFETLTAVLDVKGQSVSYELLMSLGKTFFAIPMTAFSKADGENIVFMLWPPPVYATQTQETGEQLFRLTGRPVTTLSIDRSFLLTPENLDNLLRLFESTKQNKGAISTRARDIKALSLLLVTQLEEFSKVSYLRLSSEQTAQIAKLQRLLYILMTHGVYIGDESHELFSDVDMHFPFGAKKKMNPKEAFVVRGVVNELLKSDLGATLRTCTHLNAKEGMDQLFTAEKYRVVHKIVSEGKLCGSIPEDVRDDVARYLLNEDVDAPEWLRQIAQVETLSKIAAARGVLVTIFPLFFTRSIDGAFTQSINKPDLESVIPCDGNQNPAEHKRITSPHEALTKTLIYRWHHGLSPKRLQKLIKACDEKSRKWSDKESKPYEQSPDATVFAELFPKNSGITLEKAFKIMNNSEAVHALFEPIKGSIELLMLYSRRVLEPTLEYQPRQCSSSAQDLHTYFKEGVVCSGTPKRGIYPCDMKQLMNEGTTGEAITHMKNKCPKDGIRELSKETPRELLAETIETFFLSNIEATALIDGGGLLTGTAHIEVARALLTAVHAKRPHIQAIDFFELDEASGQTRRRTLLLGASKSIPFEACQLPLEARLAYFDESHCFAANLPQALGGKGVWLVGEGHPLYKALQDAFRMRGLKKYIEFLGLSQDDEKTQQILANLNERDLVSTQSLYIGLSPQVSRAIRSKTGGAPTFENVMDYAAEEEAKRLENANLQSALSMLRATLCKHPKRAMLNLSNSVWSVLSHFRASRDLLITPTEQTAIKLYGGKSMEIDGTAALDQFYTRAVNRINKHSGLTEDERLAARNELLKVYRHTQTLALPKKVMVMVDSAGDFHVDGGMEAEVEEAAESEAATENEAENAKENALENQRASEKPAPLEPYDIGPQPWLETCPLDSSQWQWIDAELENRSALNQIQKNFTTFFSNVAGAMQSKKAEEGPEKHRPNSPDLFHLQKALKHSREPTLQALSSKFDGRIYISNRVLPQTHVPFGCSPAEPATGRQNRIAHLLIEVDPTREKPNEQILSVGCLDPYDTAYWIKRLDQERYNQMVIESVEKQRLFMVYQLPVLENLQPKQPFDEIILARNQDSSWKLRDSEDFKRIEVMIKFFNGDVNFTQPQCDMLREWQNSFSSRQSKILSEAFALFHDMAEGREDISVNDTHTFNGLVDASELEV